MKDWYSINELAEKTLIPDTTVRRYIQKFPHFFTSKGGSRSKRYEETAVKVLTRIKNLYDGGYESERVDEFLRKEFPLFTDVDKDGDSVGDKEGKAVTPTLATAEDIEEIKEALRKQMEFNKVLLDKLNKQESYIEKSLESRDQKLLETMNEIKEERKATKEAAASSEQQKGSFLGKLFGKKK